MNAHAMASIPPRMPDVSRSAHTLSLNASDARAAIRRALREMGTMIRQTRAAELGWLAPPRAAWPDAPDDQLGLKDRHEQAEQGGAPVVRVIEAHLLPEQIDRAEALLDRVRKFPKRQAIIMVGFGCRIHMGKLAKHREVRVSRRHAWRILDGGCDVLSREGTWFYSGG